MYDLYASNARDTSRFLLGRKGIQPITVVGLNPSTATQEKADTTIAKVDKASSLAGYAGFITLNLYPRRSTHTQYLSRSVNRRLYTDNLVCIEQCLRDQQAPTIWAAWGEGILLRPYFVQALVAIASLAEKNSATWVHHGPLCKGGHPRHPSRLRYAWQFARFNMERYLKDLQC